MSASRELDEPETRALVAFFTELGLTYRESVIVVLRYGLREGGSRCTQEELSQIFKVSRERISTLEKTILRKLQAPAIREKLGPAFCERLHLADEPTPE